MIAILIAVVVLVILGIAIASWTLAGRQNKTALEQVTEINKEIDDTLEALKKLRELHTKAVEDLQEEIAETKQDDEQSHL